MPRLHNGSISSTKFPHALAIVQKVCQPLLRREGAGKAEVQHRSVGIQEEGRAGARTKVKGRAGLQGAN